MTTKHFGWFYCWAWVTALHIPFAVGRRVTWVSTRSYVKLAPSRTTRHHALNDIISRAFASANISVTKEPRGLCHNDGNRPDGLTLILWQRGLSLTWDVAVAALAVIHIRICILNWRHNWAGGVTLVVRIVHVPAHCFGNFRPRQRIGCAILYDLVHKITSVSADDKERQYYSSSEDSLLFCRDSTLCCCTSRLWVTTASFSFLFSLL